ncbi:MAG: hypothetical protein ABFD66_01820 [Smithella sp.]
MKYMTVFANMGEIINYCMRANDRIVADFDILADYRIGTYFDTFAQFGVRSNNCCGMNIPYIFLPLLIADLFFQCFYFSF